MLINPPFCFLPTIYPQIVFFTMGKATDKWQGIVKILSTQPKCSRTSFCNKAAIKWAIRGVQNIVQPNIEEIWFLLETLLIFLHIRFCKKKRKSALTSRISHISYISPHSDGWRFQSGGFWKSRRYRISDIPEITQLCNHIENPFKSGLTMCTFKELGSCPIIL